ncbi:oligosaccharide flippase family protein [Algisphaera agarilytica]|uniref:PST family polysaccharide transporter n=1 Tax=Algisphaera agarilytica TaxID=1385975 RepID=A0A7X0LKT9_9BACT|nr:oligosaccharide flippase family protein [Algisphaera agarilytica]MBB6430785.1 PST family polysaccharide transporter [Algisphaera agarilytica]
MAQTQSNNLGQRAAQALAWTLLLTLFSKVISLGGQVVLAWLLAPRAFGLIGLAYTLTAFTALLQRAGIREVLVHRHRRFHLWATPGFWMSLTFGVLTSAVMLGMAPVLARVYGEPELVGLIMVLALAAPINGVASVADAKLQSQLRFGLISRVGMLQAILTMGLTILFAWLGFGAYSFVMPQPIAALFNLVCLWRAADVSVTGKPRFSCWRYLLSDSLVMLLGSVLIAVIAQGDYFILGLVLDATEVGLYFFAFNLSIQVITLFSSQFTRVLFPTLASIDDPYRQTEVYLRVSRMLTLAAMPFAGMQILIADPLIRLMFDERWYPAITIFQVLSLATVFRVVSTSAGSLLQAQGRFKFRLYIFCCYTPIFLAAVYLGTVSRGDAVGAALGVSSFYSVIGFLHVWLISHKYGGTWKDIVTIYAAPLIATALSMGIAWLAMEQLPDATPIGKIGCIALGIALMLPIYVLVARLLAREIFDEIIQRLMKLVKRKRG